MKYSLRSLTIVVTLVCVVLAALGARIEYLRQRFLFHQGRIEFYFAAGQQDISELIKLTTQINDLREGVPPSEKDLDAARAQTGVTRAKTDRDIKLKRRHEFLAERYRFAMFRPWVIVDETASP